MTKWTKPAAATIDYFERIAPGPPIEARRMFGMPSRFLNGHMLVSVFGDSLMLHLSESDRQECIDAGAQPFAPHGRSAAEYVEIQIGHFEDQTLKEWIARGMRYLGTLPPRLPKKAVTKRPSVAPASKKLTSKAPPSQAKPKAKPTPPKAKKKAAKKKPAKRPAPAKQPAAKRPAPAKQRAKKAAPKRQSATKRPAAKTKKAAKKKRR